MIRQAQRQAQKLQDDMQKVQEELEAITVEGTAGGGVVKVVMSGKQVVESVTIEPEAAEELDLLQDLIAAAVNDAFTKTQEIASQKMSAVTGGLNIPGLT
jgi:DNA-binding YbaB/EbfC family protein